jgi:hypothetical protein
MPVLRCGQCGVEFIGYNDPRYSVRFHSRDCQVEWQRRNRPKCPVCGKLTRASDDKYCSPECSHVGRRGKRVKRGSPAYERQRQRIIERIRADYAAHPEKQAARNLAKKRIPIRPCDECGSTKNVVRHHDDYSKPLDVRCLCRPCHSRIHPGRDVYWSRGLPRGTRRSA